MRRHYGRKENVTGNDCAWVYFVLGWIPSIGSEFLDGGGSVEIRFLWEDL